MNWEFIFWLFYFLVGVGSCLGFWIYGDDFKEKHGALDTFMGGLIAGILWPVILGMRIWLDGKE